MRDDEDPFDEFFDEIERMMNQMFSGNAEFRFERSRGQSGTESHDVHVDIHETDDEVRVVADIPGVTKSAIDLKCDGQTLMLEAGGDDRSYSERLALPTSVDEEGASATYNNGILEVVFPRTDESTSIDI